MSRHEKPRRKKLTSAAARYWVATEPLCLPDIIAELGATAIEIESLVTVLGEGWPNGPTETLIRALDEWLVPKLVEFAELAEEVSDRERAEKRAAAEKAAKSADAIPAEAADVQLKAAQ